MTRTAEGGYGLGMLERISLLSFAFRLFGWAGLGSQRCNTTYLLTAGKIRYLLAHYLWLTSARYKEECRCLPNRLASVLNSPGLARVQTLQEGTTDRASSSGICDTGHRISGQFQEALGTRLGS